MNRSILALSFFLGIAFSSPIIQSETRNVKPRSDEDATLPVADLIRKYGYPVEVYQLTTVDGYILRLHRIPHGRNSDTVSSRVVFLQHGLLSSSADWIMSGPNKALAYLLADEGYDVWMGNARGNSESRNHTYLDPDNDADFWAFSWHEIGYYDLPTMIDFVLETTNQPDLFYIGHSQGTTSFYVMASSRPEYNNKIRAHFSLAPIAYMNHMTSPLFKILAFWDGPLSLLLEMMGLDEFLPNNDFMGLAGDLLCSDDAITQPLCSDVLFILCGFSPAEMNATMLPVLTGHTPAGSSTRQLLHYGQEIDSGYFRQYDYDLFTNLDKYGSIWPPDYDLKAITAPIYLFYSKNDWLSAEVDVQRLYDALPNAKGKFLVGDNNFNHLDYMYGISAPEYVYSKVISLMARL